MRTKLMTYFLTPEEQAALPALNGDEQLLDWLIGHKYLLVVDWKGEDEPLQIGNFLTARLHAFQPNLAFDIQSIYGELQAANPGDSIPFLLQEFQAVLKKEGFTIVLLDRGNDSYYIGLLPGKHLKELKKQSTEFWHWRAFGTLTGEVLYTVNCSCGSMNVWQVKRGEIITDDTCQDCGREIFDKEGKSTFEVIREYI